MLAWIKAIMGRKNVIGEVKINYLPHWHEGR